MSDKKSGCGCISSFLAGGCGCLVVIVLAMAVLVFGFTAWSASRIYEGNSPENTKFAKSICEHEVPEGFTFLAGIDIVVVRAVAYRSLDKEQPAMIVLMDTSLEGLTASLLNQVFELITTQYFMKQGRIHQITMSDKQTFHLSGTNTIDRFANTVFLEDSIPDMTWYQGIFTHAGRTVYICFVELSASDERANGFYETIGYSAEAE